MSRKFITCIVATSIALTAFSPMQAHAASDNDVAKILAGITGLVILGKIIDNHNDDRQQAQQPITGYDHWRPHPTRRYDRRPNKTRMLPAVCARDVQTRHGRKMILGQRCLQRETRHYFDLPRKCLIRFQSRRGITNLGYDAKCLNRHGYRISYR